MDSKSDNIWFAHKSMVKKMSNQSKTIEMEPAKLLNMLDLSFLFSGQKPQMDSIRLNFTEAGLHVAAMDATKTVGAIGFFNKEYFASYSPIGEVDISGARLVPQLKKSYKTDKTITVEFTNEKIIVRGKSEVYDEMLPANLPAPIKEGTIKPGKRGYELTKVGIASQYKIDGSELKDLDGNEIVFNYGNKAVTAKVASDVSNYVRTIKAKEVASDKEGSVSVLGDYLGKITEKFATECWVTFCDESGPILLTMMPAEYTLTYFMAPKNVSG